MSSHPLVLTKEKGFSEEESSKLRFATDEELIQLREQFIAGQPTKYSFPEIPSDIKLSMAQFRKFLLIDEYYYRERNKWWDEIMKRTLSVDYLNE